MCTLSFIKISPFVFELWISRRTERNADSSRHFMKFCIWEINNWCALRRVLIRKSKSPRILNFMAFFLSKLTIFPHLNSQYPVPTAGVWPRNIALSPISLTVPLIFQIFKICLGSHFFHWLSKNALEAKILNFYSLKNFNVSEVFETVSFTDFISND